MKSFTGLSITPDEVRNAYKVTGFKRMNHDNCHSNSCQHSCPVVTLYGSIFPGTLKKYEKRKIDDETFGDKAITWAEKKYGQLYIGELISGIDGDTKMVEAKKYTKNRLENEEKYGGNLKTIAKQNDAYLDGVRITSALRLKSR